MYVSDVICGQSESKDMQSRKSEISASISKFAKLALKSPRRTVVFFSKENFSERISKKLLLNSERSV